MSTQYPFLSKFSIEAEAEQLRKSSEFYVDDHRGASTPIEEIAEFDLRLNIDFDNLKEEFQLGDSKQGDEQILGAMVFSSKQIFIDETLDPEENPRNEGRFRFTIAHELGHWVLHRHLFKNETKAVATLRGSEGKYSLRQKTPNARLEWQANYFASCILMPKVEVERAWYEFCESLRPFKYETCRAHLNVPFLENTWHSIGDSASFLRGERASTDQALDKQRVFHSITMEIATLLNVSVQSMQIRLKELGFIV